MESDIKTNPGKFCRTCLCKSTNMTSLTTILDEDNRTLLDMLMFIVNLDICINEKFPTQLCNECQTIVSKADAFKKRCIESEAYLKSHLYIDDFSLSEVEIPNKLDVKDEVPIKKVKNNKGNGRRKSTKSEKLKNSNLFDLIASTSCKDEKMEISNELTASDNKYDSIIGTKQTEIEMQVKMETNNDDNDLGMDFYDAEFDAPLITFKQESLAFNETKLFACSCGENFNKEEEYKTHLVDKKCKGYTKSTKIKVEKNNYSRKITIKRKIMCSDCNLEFDTKKAFRIHSRTHKSLDPDDAGSFECNKCFRKFNRKSSYTTHINHHDLKANVKYTCETCKREFQHRAHLDNHILAVHTREKGFVCEICSTSFLTQETLDTHKESHKMEKKHQCKTCNKAFYMLSTLNDHLRTHTGERPFLCSMCGKGFSQKTNLAQHVRRHQGLKPFKCEDCDRRFVSKGELVAHTRKHSGAHPFICDDCGSGFTTSSSLVKHRRTHTGERPYACDLCPMRFSASGTLKNHRRTHTGEKPFQCSFCDKAFVQRHDLISHIRCHTGERPFTCTCGLSFRKAASLKHHAKMHARDEIHGRDGQMGCPSMHLGSVHLVNSDLETMKNSVPDAKASVSVSVSDAVNNLVMIV